MHAWNLVPPSELMGDDPNIPAFTHSVAEESLSAQTTSEGGASGDGRFGSQGVGGAFVVRLPCGPNSVYLRQEGRGPRVWDWFGTILIGAIDFQGALGII